MRAVEVVDPIDLKVVAVISVNGGPPTIETADGSLKKKFEERLNTILVDGNKIRGLVGVENACYHANFSPDEPRYWPSLRSAVGDYAFRNPDTGQYL